MRGFTITSKTFGIHDVIVDEPDLERIRTLGGKWCLVFKRERYYVQKRIGGKIIEIQRFLTGAKPGEYVDHISHDTLDNRRANLRVCTNGANIRNGKIRTNNKSGVTGIWFNGKKWESYIKVFYKKIHLGKYSTKQEAIEARKLAEKAYWKS
jgi:HNH endonuclease